MPTLSYIVPFKRICVLKNKYSCQKKLNGCMDGWTDPNYRKALLLKTFKNLRKRVLELKIK